MAAFSRLAAARSTPFVLTALIILLAFGLRFHALGAQSLWNDEGNSFVQVTRSLSDIAANAARDIHPPGYYVLLSLWTKLAGTSEFALRSLSAFASVLTVALAFTLGRKLYNAWAGAAAALLVALNSFSIYYAQEARMYALLALWVALSFFCLMLLLERPTRWRILALSLVTAAGLYTQYAYALFMVAQGVIALLWWLSTANRHAPTQGSTDVGTRHVSSTSGHDTPLPDQNHHNGFPLSLRERDEGILAYIIANLIALALFLPWLPTAISQLSGWQQTGGAVVPAGEAVSILLRWLTLGVTAGSTAIAIPILLMAFAFFARAARAPERPRILAAPLWVALPLTLFLLLQLARPQNYKFMLPTQVGTALWLAGGLVALWHFAEAATARSLGRQATLRIVSRAATVMAAIWLIFTITSRLPALYNDPALQRADYRGIVQTIMSALQGNDAIILDAPNQAEVFNYYYRGDAPVYSLPIGLGGDDPQTRQAVEEIIAAHDRAFVVFWGETERDPQRIVETTLDSLAYSASDQWFGDVRLSRYIMPQPFSIQHETNALFGDSITLTGYALNSETLAPGDALQVRLQWQTDQPLDTRYKVFVQLLDANDALQAQHDGEPSGGLQPTTTWKPGETIIDNHGLILPDDLPAGEYTLIAGLYQLDPPNQRLPVGESDHLILSTIQVERP